MKQLDIDAAGEGSLTLNTGEMAAGTYTYSYQKRERESGTADSNAVYLSLIFQPEKSVWSR